MPRGSRPGERRGGRRKGTPNKAGADVRAAAREYTTEALTTLAAVMRSSESDASRVAAATALLDRAHGKPAQALAGPNGDEPVKAILEVVTGVSRAPTD